MTKTKTPAPPSAGGNAAPAEQPTFRSNPEVDAKIDAYIKENPKYWNYVQAMPRDRLERSVVLNEVRELDRQQRIREGVLKRINRNPETETRLRPPGQRPAGRPEGGRHRPNCPHRAPGRCPCARPAATKAGRCRGLKPATPLPPHRQSRKLVAPAGFRVFFGRFWSAKYLPTPLT
jgi:hypothetical protein